MNDSFRERSGTKQACPHSPLLFNNISTAIRQEKEVRHIRIGKEEVKWSLFAGDILYIKNSKDST